MSRTDWAEQFAAAFASTPLADECVFLRPKYLDGIYEREVCDLLLVLRKQAVPIQMKCQEDPSARTDEKLERWVEKQARAGLGQLQGAIRTISDSEFWCDHPRRGRVAFSPGELCSAHGVVLTEHFDNRIRLTDALPLAHRDVPISYFTVNDFLNLITELRAFPEILSYLEARGALAADAILGVGGEDVLFEYYALRGSFSGWTTYEDVAGHLESLQPQIREAMRAKREADVPAYEVEKLVSGLASNIHIGGSGDSSSYLKIQEDLLDLPLVERRKLGSQLIRVRNKVRESLASPCLSHGVAWFDSKPYFLYVCASSRGIGRDQLVNYGQRVLRAGLAFYCKTGGIAAVERDNGNYLWTYATNFVASDEDRRLGNHFFGSLRVSDSTDALIPHP